MEYPRLIAVTYFEKHLRMVAFVHLSCSSTIIFQIHTELLLQVQLSLLRAQNLLITKFKEVLKLRLMETYDREIDRNVR